LLVQLVSRRAPVEVPGFQGPVVASEGSRASVCLVLVLLARLKRAVSYAGVCLLTSVPAAVWALSASQVSQSRYRDQAAAVS
jgi:hypothetical protein